MNLSGKRLIASITTTGILLTHQVSAQVAQTPPPPTGPTVPAGTVQRASVALVLPTCPAVGAVAPVDGEAMARILRAELSGDGVTDVSVVPATDTEVGLARVTFVTEQCTANASSLTLQVDDAVTRKHVERAVDLSDVTGAIRTRTLALAVAELLRASWAELELPDVPQSAVPVPVELRTAMRTRLSAPSENIAQNSGQNTANTAARLGGSNTSGNNSNSVTNNVAVIPPPETRVPNQNTSWWLGGGVYAVDERPGRAGIHATIEHLRLQSRAWALWLRPELYTDVGFASHVFGNLLGGTATVGFSSGILLNPRSLVSVSFGARLVGGFMWARATHSSVGAELRGLPDPAPYLLAGLVGGIRTRITPRWSALVEFFGQGVMVSPELCATVDDPTQPREPGSQPCATGIRASNPPPVLFGTVGVALGVNFSLLWQL